MKKKRMGENLKDECKNWLTNATIKAVITLLLIFIGQCNNVIVKLI